MASAAGYTVGQRVLVDRDFATVRFVGPVEGTSGVWLGVDWDDPRRGKHDGSKDGRRYFQTRLPTSGSFLRPSARIPSGVSFFEAFKGKYVSPTGAESLVDGTRCEHLDWTRLRDVGLESARVSRAGDEHRLSRLGKELRGVTSLDLSKNLLSSFEEVAAIAETFPGLRTLVLNDNLLTYDAVKCIDLQRLQHVRHLHLCRTSWDGVPAATLLASLPNLESLDWSQCNIKVLQLEQSLNTSIVDLELGENQFEDWPPLLASLKSLPHLKRVGLSHNRLGDLERSEQSVPSIESLDLSSNNVVSWTTLDRLASVFPLLRRLSIRDNPFSAAEDEKAARLLIVGRLTLLEVLENSPVSRAERAEAERFYWARIQREDGTISEKGRRHARLQELRQSYGEPEAGPQPVRPTLKSRLLNLKVLAETPPDNSTIAVLPSTPVRALRAKLVKLLARKDITRIYALLGEERIRVEMDDGAQVVAWYGVEDGDCIEVV